MSGPPAHDAVALDVRDDVATVLRDVERGETVRVRVGGKLRTLASAERIALCHKVALRDIAAGEPVRKHGEVIGEALEAIASGAHVHVHNLRSRRGSGRTA